MDKTKLFIYENAKPHVHDNSPIHWNTIPFSKQGIKDHCEVVTDPEIAEYFYMGQLLNDKFGQYHISDFEFLNKYPKQHICDIEGEGGQPIPSWLHNCIITTMGPLKVYGNQIFKLFTRPTFSNLLIDIVHNRNNYFNMPERNGICFRGFVNCQTRHQMINALAASGLPLDIVLNSRWLGPSEIGSEEQESYIRSLLSNQISLCPRGSGIDSVRLIETCYYQRIPVLISNEDYFLVGEDHYDMSFIQRYIDPIIDSFDFVNWLDNLNNKQYEEKVELGNKAKAYFDEVIRVYFADPTKYFLNWLQNDTKQDI